MCRVVYLKGENSYSAKAVRKLGYKNEEYAGLNSFSEICEAVVNAADTIGVLPIENSLAGSLYQIYDLISKYKLSIIAETYVSINHALVGSKRSELKDIKTVVSHPKALEQCEKFLARHPTWNLTFSISTDAAAERLASAGDGTIAAIVAPEAAEHYSLDVLIPNVQDHQSNQTRFIAVASENCTAGGNKVSVTVTLPHMRGSLARLLIALASQGANLLKIESRPIKNTPFEYLFYLDLIVSPKNIPALLDFLKGSTNSMTHLGTYEGELCQSN